MNKRKIAKMAVAGIMGLGMAAMMTACDGCVACGNQYSIDTNWVMNYVVIEENGQNVLHEVYRWGDDSSSDSLVFRTNCCHNYIWAHMTNANMYQDKPAEYTYDMACPGMGK